MPSEAIGKVADPFDIGIKDYITDPLGKKANASAMDAQRQATAEANKTLGKVYGEQRDDLQPWMTAGTDALGKMQDADYSRDFTAADFTKDPGYDFRMQEGQKALEASAAARGNLLGGNFATALAKYGQDYASNEYGNAYNRFNSDRDRRFGRLSNIAGMGQNATNQMVNAGGMYGANLSGNQIGLGNALAAGNIANGNANRGITTALVQQGAKAGSSAMMGG